MSRARREDSRQKPPRGWKHFERLTAALHHLKHAGADVQWNDRIAGRQVDVSIRFNQGMYPILIAIECRELGRNVGIERVEAFVTKLRGIGAQLGVMVSAAGFQAGAKSVARQYGIELFRLTEVEERLPNLIQEAVTIPFANVFDVRVTFASGVRRALPDTDDYLRGVRFTDRSFRISIGQLLQRYTSKGLLKDAPVEITVPLTGQWFVHLPDEPSPKWVRKLRRECKSLGGDSRS